MGVFLFLILVFQVLFGGFGFLPEDLEANVLRKWTRNIPSEQSGVLSIVPSVTQEHLFTTVKFAPSDALFELEVADSPEERTKGLMFRESMEERHGMIFLFDDEKLRYFWMKNTLIALDMIFIDKHWRIIKVQANVPPCSETETPTCRVYGSDAPAKYVIELNAGTAKKYGIRDGSSAILSAQ